MKAAAVLRIARKAARRTHHSIEEILGWGKGSHRTFRVLDTAGTEVARFQLTSHSKDVSWGVLRSIEQRLEDLFGAKWMEDQ